jgi:hypothetical protein
MEVKRHRQNHPATRKQKKTLASLTPRPTASLAWARMVGPRSFDASATYLASCSNPCPSPWGSKGRKGSRDWEPCVIPFLDLDFLGAMAKRGARCRRSPKECGGEGSRRRDAVAAKGLRMLPKPPYRAWAWAHHLFHSHINRSSGFCPVREPRHCGKLDPMHDPSGLWSTRVPLFWHHARPGNMTGHIKV